MPYVIADEEFPTKDALTRKSREILARTPDYQPVNGPDTEFLLQLFEHHDEWKEKSFGGVHYITIQTTVHGTRCFMLRKQNGDLIDISFVHAIRQIHSTRKADQIWQELRDFQSAARSAVNEQIRTFRDEKLKLLSVCPITGEEIVRSNAAVDHAYPDTFDALLFRFCQELSINPLHVHVKSKGGVVAVFADSQMESDWQEFHQSHANLRLVSRVGNLQLPKSKVEWSKLWS